MYVSQSVDLSEPIYFIHFIPNGCLDADEVKVDLDIFQYQEKVKLISQFNGLS